MTRFVESLGDFRYGPILKSNLDGALGDQQINAAIGCKLFI